MQRFARGAGLPAPLTASARRRAVVRSQRPQPLHGVVRDASRNQPCCPSWRMPPLRRGRVAHAEGDGGEAHEVEPLPLIQVIEEDSKDSATRSDLIAKLEKRIAGLEENLLVSERSVEEAAGLREALEAEAQEVAQRAVEALEARDAVVRQLEEARAAFKQLCDEEVATEAEVQKLPLRLSKARAALAKKEQQLQQLQEREKEREKEKDADGKQAESTATQAGAGGKGEGSKEEEWEPKTVEVDAMTAAIAECERELSEGLDRLEALSRRKEEAEGRIRELEAWVDAASASASKVDEMAAAAMKATENAVAAELAAQTKAWEVREDLEQAQAIMAKLQAGQGQGREVETPSAAAQSVAEERAGEGSADRVDGDVELPTSPSPTPSGKMAQAPKSSRYMAASFFSSGQGGDVEDAFEAVAAWFARNRWLVAVASAVAMLGFAVLAQRAHWFSGLGAAFSELATRAAGVVARVPIPVIESGFRDVLVLLATSILTVPLMTKIPGGSPVLGFLLGGALIGPYSTGMVSHVHVTKHIAELGVVFLLFHIGLELSLERLQSMGKFVFGLGSLQVAISTAAIAVAVTLASAGAVSGPASIVVGSALALSSTAIALQVLQDRGESGAKHGRATFSVLLLQDLAVVMILMLIPLLAPQPGGGAVPLTKIASALGVATLKAMVCIAAIIAGGRLLMRPLYRAIASTGNAEIFAATTLLVCLGTAELTQMFGLSLALGAFLAGLLLAETEYSLQVESDIAPYRGLLLGLFFMTVGMEIPPRLLAAKWATVLGGVAALVVGKVAVMVAIAPAVGMSKLAAFRAGTYLGPGGEFAFVALGDAVARGILAPEISNILFCVTALSMAITPYIAAVGGMIADRFETKSDVKDLQPSESETNDLTNHVIICGFGRIGQIIAQVLSERLIPFVALDVRSDRVAAGRQLDLPVYFGDAGSAAVLHAVGGERAACAVVALDSPGANYRTVYTLAKNFPKIKTYVRARDVDHGVILEKAGASAVVPETLEPSLQLAAAVLRELSMPADEVAATMDAFRRQHIKELTHHEDPILSRAIKKEAKTLAAEAGDSSLASLPIPAPA